MLTNGLVCRRCAYEAGKHQLKGQLVRNQEKQQRGWGERLNMKRVADATSRRANNNRAK